MADRYWVGGTGTWSSSSTANWSASSGGASGASVPTSGDNVFFDANSNVGTGSFTVTMANSPRVCKDFTASGLDGAMTLEGTGIGLTVSGALSFPATNFTASYTGTTTFTPSTNTTITTNGVAFSGNLTINASGGGVICSLGSALSVGSNVITVNIGVLDTAFGSNYAITAGSLTTTGGGNDVQLREATLTLSNSSSSAFAATLSGANLFADTNSTIVFTAATVAINLGSGNKTIGNVSFTNTGIGTIRFLGNIGSSQTITCTNLTFNTFSAVGVSEILLEPNIRVTNTLTLTGSNGSSRVFVRPNTSSFASQSLYQRTIQCDLSTTVSDVDFRDIAITGAASPLSGTRLGDCGGNTNITFDAAKTVYWSLVGGGNWSSTAWATTSGGTPSTANFPLAQDSVIIENTGLNTSATVTIDGNYNIGSFFSDTRTNAMTLASGTTSPTFYNSCTYGSGITLSGIGTFTFSIRSAKTLNSGGITFTQNIVIRGPGGSTLQLLTNNLTTTRSFTLAEGVFNLNNLTLTTASFQSPSTYSTTRILTFGTGVINCTGTGTVWSLSGLFSSSGTPVVNITSSGSTAITVTGDSTNQLINFNFTGGTYPLTFFASGFRASNVNFSGYSGTLQAISNASIYGNLTLSSGMTIAASSNTLTFASTSGTKTITCNGTTIDFPITFNGAGGTWQLQDALTLGATKTCTLTNGTVNLNGQTLSAGSSFTTASGTKNLTFNGGTLVCPNGSTAAFNNAQPTNFTTTAGTGTGTINMTSASTKTFVGGGSTYNCTLNQGGAGALTVTGNNTFNNITNTIQPASVLFTAGSTNTFNSFSLSGTPNNLITIGSPTAASHTLSKSSGVVTATYCSISRSTATGGAVWRATYSVDGGNNSGWQFVSGAFFLFFECD